MCAKKKDRPPLCIRHSAIVRAQADLLAWCPNVEGVQAKDLEYICWACGWECRNEDGKRRRMSRCHIVPYQKGETEKPDNFILLCKRCHAEQPDTLPKHVLKYWLYTRESALERLSSEFQTIRRMVESVAAAMKKQFGQPLLDRGMHEVSSRFGEDGSRKKYIDHCIDTSAGQGRRNIQANVIWGLIGELYDWCVANKDRIEEIESECEDEGKESGRKTR